MFQCRTQIGVPDRRHSSAVQHDRVSSGQAVRRTERCRHRHRNSIRYALQQSHYLALHSLLLTGDPRLRVSRNAPYNINNTSTYTYIVHIQNQPHLNLSPSKLVNFLYCPLLKLYTSQLGYSFCFSKCWYLGANSHDILSCGGGHRAATPRGHVLSQRQGTAHKDLI